MQAGRGDAAALPFAERCISGAAEGSGSCAKGFRLYGAVDVMFLCVAFISQDESAALRYDTEHKQGTEETATVPPENGALMTASHAEGPS